MTQIGKSLLEFVSPKRLAFALSRNVFTPPTKLAKLPADTFVSSENLQLIKLHKQITDLGEQASKLIEMGKNPIETIKLHWKFMEANLDEAISNAPEAKKQNFRDLRNTIVGKTADNTMAVTDDILLDAGFKPKLTTIDPLLSATFTQTELQKAAFNENKQIINKIFADFLGNK